MSPKFRVIEGGASMRENAKLPRLWDDPKNDTIARNYILDLLDATKGIFASYEILPESITEEEVADMKATVLNIFAAMHEKEPTVYDFYVWLHTKLSDVQDNPDHKPDKLFSTELIAVLALAGVE